MDPKKQCDVYGGGGGGGGGISTGCSCSDECSVADLSSVAFVEELVVLLKSDDSARAASVNVWFSTWGNGLFVTPLSSSEE